MIASQSWSGLCPGFLERGFETLGISQILGVPLSFLVAPKIAPGFMLMKRLLTEAGPAGNTKRLEVWGLGPLISAWPANLQGKERKGTERHSQISPYVYTFVCLVLSFILYNKTITKYITFLILWVVLSNDQAWGGHNGNPWICSQLVRSVGGLGAAGVWSEGSLAGGCALRPVESALAWGG